MSELLRQQNPHWEGGRYIYPLKREAYKTLLENLKNKLIISIEGPRRVGKSILMKQMIEELISNGTNPYDILYFSFDDYTLKVMQIVKEFEELKKQNIREKKYYLFFDEIQKIKDWQVYVKILYDNYPNLKLIISGSTLRVSKKESLAGRILEFFIKPLSFKEYLLFINKEKILNSDVDETFLTEYKNYLFKQYPDIALDQNLNIKNYIASIIKKIVFEDSDKYFKDSDKDLLHSITCIILRDPGQIIDYNDLAKDLGVDRKSISKYINFLVKSSLIRKVYNFSNNARKIETKAKKFYPFCTTLTKYVTDDPNLSKIIECDVAFQTDADFFWNNRNEEIDFILNEENKRIGVEVKFRNVIDYNDIKTFSSIKIKKLKLDQKILIIKEYAKINTDLKEIDAIKYYALWKNLQLFRRS